MPRQSAAMKLLLSVALLFILSLAAAQVDQQHPYRQSTLKTRVKLQSSREKEDKYRYSPWGNLSSSDRRYTQKVRLRIAVTNVSPTAIEGLRIEYRIYQRNLGRNLYTVAAAGEMGIPRIASNETKTLLTDEATCQYRLRWSNLVRGNRLSRSGEKYAGYVVIYSDRKGPVRWDLSSQTMYAQYARELREKQKLAAAASSKGGIVSFPSSEKPAPLLSPSEATVYVTKTGRKFHRETCRYVRKGARPILKKDALELGYTPCAICKP